MHATPGGAQLAGWRHVQVAQPLASWTNPSAHAMLHIACGQLTAWLPVGHVLHWQVGQPFASSATPFGHMGLQPRPGHIAQEGGCHAHLPSVPREQAAGTIGPMHIGWA
jgi:hypothetical protein